MTAKLITTRSHLPEHVENGLSQPDLPHNVLKPVVVDRYTDRYKAVACVHGLGLKHGALSGSVAHGSHNIVAVGTTDQELCEVINAVIAHKGGISVIHGGTRRTLPLPVAGPMSDGYSALARETKALSGHLSAPFMTLSFMAVLVIPRLKLSDRGLLEVNAFRLT